MCYAGPFTADFRRHLSHDKWIPLIIAHEIPISLPVTPLDVLGDVQTQVNILLPSAQLSHYVFSYTVRPRMSGLPYCRQYDISCKPYQPLQHAISQSMHMIKFGHIVSAHWKDISNALPYVSKVGSDTSYDSSSMSRCPDLSYQIYGGFSIRMHGQMMGNTQRAHLLSIGMTLLTTSPYWSCQERWSHSCSSSSSFIFFAMRVSHLAVVLLLIPLWLQILWRYLHSF